MTEKDNKESIEKVYLVEDNTNIPRAVAICESIDSVKKFITDQFYKQLNLDPSRVNYINFKYRIIPTPLLK